MENESRIVELLAESLFKFDQMIDGHKAMVAEQKETNKRLDSMDQRLGKVESEVIKLNLQTMENTRAIFKLAEEVENIAHLHERVSKLEKAVYK
jgi:tetrahydromethanopterin S-methyltransferase subunit G